MPAASSQSCPTYGPESEIARLREAVRRHLVGARPPGSIPRRTHRRSTIDGGDRAVRRGRAHRRLLVRPVSRFRPVLERMAIDPAQVWAMVENAGGQSETFSDAGFPGPLLPWSWTALGATASRLRRMGAVLGSERSRTARPQEEADVPRVTSARAGRERRLRVPRRGLTRVPTRRSSLLLCSWTTDAHFSCARCSCSTRRTSIDSPSSVGRSSIMSTTLGFPLAPILAEPRANGSAEGAVRDRRHARSAARHDVAYDHASPFRIAVIVHVSDLDSVHELFCTPRLPPVPVRPVRHDDRRQEGGEAPAPAGRRRRPPAALVRRPGHAGQPRTRHERLLRRLPRRPAWRAIRPRREGPRAADASTRPSTSGATSGGTSTRICWTARAMSANLLALFQTGARAGSSSSRR